ncbi:MAG: ribosome small subunit-dependent GTPase A [Lachnospiraceae bacterium]|nr:ribosome small subunit-dependent GTPase A [Lachnospiraceae bacterium]
MQGRILKGIAGFYYIQPENSEDIYECKAKGIFRKRQQKPLVGDLVEIEVIDSENLKGNIVKLCPRKNSLIRPAVANVDQAVVIFAMKRPDPLFTLLDSFLIMMRMAGLPVVLVFNKEDLADESEKEEFRKVYAGADVKILFTSAAKGIGVDEVRDVLRGKVSTVAGPSGAGKSTLINMLCGSERMETGAVSEKIGRGKQTTRHTELLEIESNSFIMDTPGFSSLELPEMEKEDLEQYYPEFDRYRGNCYFKRCVHIHEPGCSVRDALEEGDINIKRYESYKSLYETLDGRRRY